MFRRKTACLWWTNTKSTSALKPNWGFWRSSLASRIHPSPSKIVPFASDIACTISNPILTVVHQRPPPSLLTQPLEKKKKRLYSIIQKMTYRKSLIFRLLSFFSTLTSFLILRIMLRWVSHQFYVCIYIYRHQALNSSSDHTDGHHISTPTSFIGVFMLSEGVIWVCVCILVQIYTILYLGLNISMFFLIETYQWIIECDFSARYKSEDSCIKLVLFLFFVMRLGSSDRTDKSYSSWTVTNSSWFICKWHIAVCLRSHR